MVAKLEAKQAKWTSKSRIGKWQLEISAKVVKIGHGLGKSCAHGARVGRTLTIKPKPSADDGPPPAQPKSMSQMWLFDGGEGWEGGHLGDSFELWKLSFVMGKIY